MATFGPQFGEDDKGALSIESIRPGLAEVYFRPSDARLRAAGRLDDPTARRLLLRFDTGTQTTTIFPIHTMPTSNRFLRPKHSPILSIELSDNGIFEDFDDFDQTPFQILPRTVADVEDYLAECLPTGFTKDPNYGLGLDRRLGFIPRALAQIEGVKTLRLTDHRDLDVALTEGDSTFEMSYSLFDALRRGANRLDVKAQTSSLKKKQQSAHVNLLTKLDEARFPPQPIGRSPDDVADAIGEVVIDARLSDRDRGAVVKLAQASVRNSLNTHRSAIVKLHDEIELASLDELIAQLESYLPKALTEARWQALFEANPFILDMAFSVPVLFLQRQAHVGGKKLDGSGDKITDFLFANQLTDNMAVLEIKTPSTPLLSKRPYRDAVYGPSSELAGAITQVLDQVQRLQSQIFQLQSLNRQHRLESYGIKAVLVAGVIPNEPNLKRSFELFRSTLSGVTVITFDELLAKLKSLRALLRSRR
ncbi:MULTISPECIES: Shedu immune nuclease family protein [unclassified Mesorhizobium]|uniref:Shedu immune nuclease family protein n=1 Tax=unclassified Mesorhizobium TaxID=325217 RepID=UPI000FDB484D|nr:MULTISPECIES: Shedu immune nuclease family protein [unclassified Mesorhizobium]TGR23152.1 DUF4263 domain-containing protein [Mesorhizobium sp. M8A.F.Ca.ET.197.01.1.1]TGR39236.1 DUF4263 domain-containing protein [bacterium M00.F.Ca.ET.199.01.1.1]TGR46831.1 DUF4263 domain-containing protein [Mesorhizobium sp. M8A.F.Ca.ET.198.01.1.1]TGV85091.1 DUF4263 domain-containing protein [Mesorhizobium sp. M00.F.Ca.ET.149.01.1.1]